MVKVKVKIKDNRWQIAAKGHAKTEICNGISMLFWALFDSLCNSEARIHDAVITNGNFVMDAEIENDEEKGMFMVVYVGLRQLAKKYSDQVKIVETDFPKYSTNFDN